MVTAKCPPRLPSSSESSMVVAKPDPGVRPRHVRGPAMESADRDQRLIAVWCLQLREELVISGAPVLETLAGSQDRDRANEMLAEKTRATTLKRYVIVFQQWRLWLLETKQAGRSGLPADLLDYFLLRRDETCGKSIPELVMKAISWMEKVAKFPLLKELRLGGLPGLSGIRLWKPCRRGHHLQRGPCKVPGSYAGEARGGRSGQLFGDWMEDLGLGQTG